MKKSFKAATQCYFEKFQLDEQQLNAINKMQSEACSEGYKDNSKLKWYRRRQVNFSLAGVALFILVVGLQLVNPFSKEGDRKERSDVAYNRSLMRAGLTIREQIDRQLNQQQVGLAGQDSRTSLSKNISYRSPANKVRTFNPVNRLRRQIAGEIVYNYNKNLAMEIRTTDLEKVDDFYSKLDFLPIIPEVLQSGEWQLLGGRYCSIQQRLAAQMKLLNKKNQKIYTLYQYQLAEDSILKHFTEPWQIKKNDLIVTLWVEKGLLHAIASN